MKKIIQNWYWAIVILFLLFAGLVYLIVGEKSYIAVHDNMDLFIAQYKMLKDTHTFFAHGVDVPFLGGISRDNLPSELALTSVFYMIFPTFTAYVLNYLTKVALAVVGSYLLASEIWGGAGNHTTHGPVAQQSQTDEHATQQCQTDEHATQQCQTDEHATQQCSAYRYLSVLCGLAYGMLNLFPNFGIPFSALPLIVYLLLKVDRAENFRKCIPWYAAIFAYPFISYFSYLGLFLCGYLLIAFIWVSIYRKKFAGRLLLSLILLAIGYVCFEYRLFSVMLLGKEETIRTLMVGLDLSIPEMLGEVWDSLVNGMMHVESLQGKWVFPLCMIYFLGLNLWYILKKTPGKIVRDWYNFLILFMFFNSLVYGLWDYKPLRDLVGILCPPLEGWQYNRTLFFNPCLWYAALFLMLYRLVKAWHSEAVQKRLSEGLKVYAADIVAVAVIFIAIMITFLSDTRYNDLMHTCYKTALHVIKGKEIDSMNYEQFYSEELFEEAKEAIGYEGEWAVAYGLHPAVLEYNTIATLDGYLGYYSTSYKEAFRKMIAPALDRVEGHRINFDNWGARAYIYPGGEMAVVSEFIQYGPLDDYNLYMDIQAFHDLDGSYIFSRVPIENGEELGLKLVYAKEAGSILESGNKTAYALYVYR